MTVAVLFCDPQGVYSGLHAVEPWGLPERDAMQYAGPWSIVAHPPCQRWCMMAASVQGRYGYRIGDDGGTFDKALELLCRFGGVLEHPAFSLAWEAFGIPAPTKPARGEANGKGWAAAGPGAWVCEVYQHAYGHAARKRTWLLYVGRREPFPLDFRVVPKGTALAQVSCDRRDPVGWSGRPRLRRKASSATPPSFAASLINLAAQCGGAP